MSNGQVATGLRTGVQGLGTGLGSSAGRFPRSMQELNSIFAPWAASFSHAWGFEEASGDGTIRDLTRSSPVDLTVNAGTQGKLSQLVGTDKCFSVAQGAAEYASSATGDLVPGTGDLVVLLTTKLSASSSGALFRKFFNGAASGLYRLLVASGQLTMEFYDGTTLTNSLIALNHEDGKEHDVLFVVSRQGATKRQQLASDLGVSSIGTPPTLTLSNLPEGFLIGDTAAAGQDVSFLAWGQTPGQLLEASPSNLAAAVKVWRRRRGAS